MNETGGYRRTFGTGRSAPGQWLMASLTLLAMGLLTGCALRPSPPMPVYRPAVNTTGWADHQWWHVRYRFSWPDGADPDWHLDLLLAHRVAAPVISDFDGDMPLWRFHRRAARDATGHQFSVIFYTNPQTARSVIAALQSHSLVDRLQSTGHILDVIDDAGQDHQPQPIETTSDAQWSAPVRQSWPYYILGVSRMWLGMIASVAADGQPPADHADTAALVGYYKKVSDRINSMWQEEGRHALLHHLNALFGYEPLVVYEKRFLRF